MARSTFVNVNVSIENPEQRFSRKPRWRSVPMDQALQMSKSHVDAVKYLPTFGRRPIVIS